MYRPSVAKSDITISRKIELVNIDLNVKGPSVAAMFSIPLNASRNAATCKFQVLSLIASVDKKGKTHSHVYCNKAETNESHGIPQF